MPKSYPKVQDDPGFSVGEPRPVRPTDGYAGCVLVDVVTVDGQAKLRIVGYVAAEQTAGSMTYTAKSRDSAWVVDLPRGFRTRRDSIRTAIAHAPDRPNPTPPWK